MQALSDGGMSAMVTWQARARDWEPRLQTWRSWTLTTPSTASMPERISVERDAARRAFQKDVEGFADDADAGPEDERGDEQREGGVDPVVAGEQDARAAGDDGGCRERVAGHVEKGGAQVDVAGHAPQQSGDHAVHHHAGGGHDHHEPGCTATGAREPVDGFDADPEGDDDERGRIDEGGQHAGPLVAEGLGVVGGAGLEVDGGKAEQEGQEIGDVVAGLGEQGQRVGAQPGHKGDARRRRAWPPARSAERTVSCLRSNPKAPRGDA